MSAGSHHLRGYASEEGEPELSWLTDAGNSPNLEPAAG